jgi:hypothetical protein
MKFINEEIIRSRFIAKLKALSRLLKSGSYIVISIDRNPKSRDESVNFQFNVTDTELEFYAMNLIEFRKSSLSLLENAKKIIKN